MKKAVMCAVLAVLLGGCTSYETASVQGKNTNRWKVVKNFSGDPTWSGALLERDNYIIVYEQKSGRYAAFEYILINSSSCSGPLIVDGVEFISNAKMESYGGANACRWMVSDGSGARQIASEMAEEKDMQFNGSEISTKGFGPLWYDYFKMGIAE